MRSALLTLLCVVTTAVHSQSLETRFAEIGKVVVLQLPSAPFPAAKRDSGHSYGKAFYSAEDHYRDSTVGVFIPKGFRKDKPLDLIVHIHGWFNNVDSVFAQFRLAEQLAASKRNAILVIPQGPKNAPDSYGGKLEDPGAFKRFIGEVTKALQAKRLVSTRSVRHVVLSGHSGAYHAMSYILMQGGMNEKVREVYLFDAIYGQIEKFAYWIDHTRGRFVAITTDSGGTKEETAELKEALKAWHFRFADVEEKSMTATDLKKNRLVFIHTDLEHNQVLSARDEFREFLETGPLEKR